MSYEARKKQGMRMVDIHVNYKIALRRIAECEHERSWRTNRAGVDRTMRQWQVLHLCIEEALEKRGLSLVPPIKDSEKLEPSVE